MAGQQNGGRSFQTIMEDFGKQFSSMKQPDEFITLLSYFNVMYSPIRICIQAGLFRQLAASSQPVPVNELIKPLKAASDTEEDIAAREEYVDRMLRAVHGMNLVDHTAAHVYEANDLTRTIADPGYEAGFTMIFDTIEGPSSTNYKMLSWAENNGYKAPTTSTDGPYQQARGIAGTTAFEDWTRRTPVHMSNLSKFMSRIQKNRLNWSEWFPADALFGSTDDSAGDEVFLVDIGGGLGHDLSGLASRYPDRKMRLVLEDQPEVIAEARGVQHDPRVELQEHDFFKPQPVKNAKIYFMHKIMHDWPDDDCANILSHLRDAMAPTSRIFLNDTIVPDLGNSMFNVASDICMLAELSSKERSETMWTRLITQVEGLSISKFWQAPELKGEGIVEIVKAS